MSHKIQFEKSAGSPKVSANLAQMLASNKFVRVLEVHNAISALIAENITVEVDGETRQFDAFWESSLTDSLSKGKPDIAVVDMSSRMQTVDQIVDVTKKPVIFDADNGGLEEHFVFTVRSLERLSVQAVVIEDKIGLKRNSLFGTTVEQTQDDPEVFATKIAAGKMALRTKDFLIIARIESLILNRGQEDAMHRARIYVNAGADGILIHSCKPEAQEVLDFARVFRAEFPTVPLVAIPTTYNHIKDDDLRSAGFNMVIYANHMMRSAVHAMTETAGSILLNKRSSETDSRCISIKQAISLL